jgi:hypothetical protein
MSSNTRSVKVVLEFVLAEVPASVTPEAIRERVEGYADGMSVPFFGDSDDAEAYVTAARVTLIEDVTEAEDTTDIEIGQVS